jgi:hypothetical protein
MEAGTTTTHRARRRGILAAGAGVLAVVATGGVLVASGAWAAPRAGAPASTPQADQVGIEAIWGQTDPAARHAICASHLADPDGAWQVLAPVLTAHGADRASTQALLDLECAATVTVADVRG